MKKLIKKITIKLTGNRIMQQLLERNVAFSQFVMGIGSGGSVDSSGEAVIFSKLRQMVEPPLCIFDVGANKGQFMNLALDKLRGLEIHVHAFEPSAHTYTMLCDNVRNRNNVILNNCGLGKQIGEFDLFYDAEGSGLASLTKRRLDHFGITFMHTEKIKLDTLDNYCAVQKINRINLLKLDVEGHELDVLAGGKRMFDSKAIDLVSFEFGGCNIDTRTYFQDFFYFFMEYGMNISRITPSGYLSPVTSYKEIDEQFRTMNFLAMRREINNIREVSVS